MGENWSRSGSWNPEEMAGLIEEALLGVGEKQPPDYKPSADDAAEIRGYIRAIKHAIAAKDPEEVRAGVALLVESMLGHYARHEAGRG